VIVLGIDPGKTTGWAMVEDGARLLAFGVLATGDEEAHLAELIKRPAIPPSLVVVEMAGEIHPVRRKGFAGISTDQATALLRAGEIGAGLLCEAKHCGVERERVTSEEWRRAICEDAQADNATIETALRLRLARMPPPRKSNNHERDAMGVALFGFLRWNLRRANK